MPAVLLVLLMAPIIVAGWLLAPIALWLALRHGPWLNRRHRGERRSGAVAAGWLIGVVGGLVVALVMVRRSNLAPLTLMPLGGYLGAARGARRYVLPPRTAIEP